MFHFTCQLGGLSPLHISPVITRKYFGCLQLWRPSACVCVCVFVYMLQRGYQNVHHTLSVRTFCWSWGFNYDGQDQGWGLGMLYFTKSPHKDRCTREVR